MHPVAFQWLAMTDIRGHTVQYLRRGDKQLVIRQYRIWWLAYVLLVRGQALGSKHIALSILVVIFDVSDIFKPLS
jgi:hypothetical protein